MSFQAQIRPRTGQPRDGLTFILESSDGNDRAEIWPTAGFNCVAWSAASVPMLFALRPSSAPSRMGIPILFPFPNRIRAGRFIWNGREYQLPINDPQQKNAIHGFVMSRPWRIAETGADDEKAWVRGVFHGSIDAPECRALWPADYRIEVTYTLTRRQLRLDVAVTNPDSVELPFGFGLHPYFSVPADRAAFFCASPGTVERWKLDQCLPTGDRNPLGPGDCCFVDLSAWTGGSPRHWDDAFRWTGPAGQGLILELRDPERGSRLIQTCGPGFRDFVVFTPPHRQAVCLEPYTCATDAINLQQRGIDAGLLCLAPGASWRSYVEWRYILSV